MTIKEMMRIKNETFLSKRFSENELVFSLFLLCGLWGGLVFFLIALYQTNFQLEDFTTSRIALRLILSSIFGLVTYFILMMPHSLISQMMGHTGSLNYDSYLLLPFLAGLFIEPFYKYLEDKDQKYFNSNSSIEEED